MKRCIRENDHEGHASLELKCGGAACHLVKGLFAVVGLVPPISSYLDPVHEAACGTCIVALQPSRRRSRGMGCSKMMDIGCVLVVILHT